MFKALRRRITFGNVIACLALFIALGGTVYAAGRLSGKQIKPHSIPGNRLRNHTLTDRQMSTARLTAGFVAMVHYQTATGTLPANGAVAQATAQCRSGLKVVGGGALLSDPSNSLILDSGPVGNNGFTAQGFYYGSGSGQTMTVTAICVAARSTTTTNGSNPYTPSRVPARHSK